MMTRLCTRDEVAAIPQLVELLQDAVHGGAAVGFLSPLSDARAEAYWRRVLSSVGEDLYLWVCEAEGKIVGSVQLELSTKENGAHRAEIQKLFVLAACRGRGISSRLMKTAESKAASLGRSLLFLDTQAGSTAESVYRHLGWTAAGQIPDYAASPDGQLHATAYFYKRMRTEC